MSVDFMANVAGAYADLLYEGFEGRTGLRSFPYHEYEEW